MDWINQSGLDGRLGISSSVTLHQPALFFWHSPDGGRNILSNHMHKHLDDGVTAICLTIDVWTPDVSPVNVFHLTAQIWYGKGNFVPWSMFWDTAYSVAFKHMPNCLKLMLMEWNEKSMRSTVWTKKHSENHDGAHSSRVSHSNLQTSISVLAISSTGSWYHCHS